MSISYVESLQFIQQITILGSGIRLGSQYDIVLSYECAF